MAPTDRKPHHEPAAARFIDPMLLLRTEMLPAGDRWLYELRVTDAKGRLFEVYVDAHSGAIDRIKEK